MNEAKNEDRKNIQTSRVVGSESSRVSGDSGESSTSGAA